MWRMTAAARGRLVPVIGDVAKEYLHSELRELRDVMVWKLDGLCEYDIRRPLTSTGTNLLGLVKHLSIWESRYFGEVFDRPFPNPLPGWDETGERGTDLWATEHETREEILDRYRRVGANSDATIIALAIDAPGHVPWWPRPKVTLFNILIHMLTETSRHAGHADILREQLDGATGTAAAYVNPQRDPSLQQAHRATIEQAARRAANLSGSKDLTGR